MIICAAINLTYKNKNNEIDSVIICGHRHGDCFLTMKHIDIVTKVKEVQGFIDHTGRFLNRKEAFEHFKACGQSTSTQRWYWEDRNQTELYSEDLY